MAGDGADDSGVFGRRLLLAIDATGYGGISWRKKLRFRQVMGQLTDVAADVAGLDRLRWETEDHGDSLFAVLPEGTSEFALIDTFVRALDAGLHAYNRDLMRQTSLKLRVAVHFGLVAFGANGFVGRSVVEIHRILNCRPLRTVVSEASDVNLAVGVSATVFQDLVQTGDIGIQPEEFQQVRIQEKKFCGDAWIWVPGAFVTNAIARSAAGSFVRNEEESLTRDEAATVATDSGKTIDYNLARLFYHLGPPPDSTSLNNEQVSSDDGGTRR